MNISIELAKIEEKEILKNLGELYIYELSQYAPMDVNDNGLFDNLDDIDTYWTEKNKYPYFIKVNNKLAGFILVYDGRQIDEIESSYAIDDFFIMLNYKRQGIGQYCIKYIFEKYKGKWQIWFHPNNKPAKYFWTKIIDEYSNGKFEIIKNNEPFYDGSIGETFVFDS
jgi:predicted acetyltransferase